jgi:hypothetical protein
VLFHKVEKRFAIGDAHGDWFAALAAEIVGSRANCIAKRRGEGFAEANCPDSGLVAVADPRFVPVASLFLLCSQKQSLKRLRD